MQKKYWIIPGIIATTLVASLLALSSPNRKSAPAPEKPTCCKKTMTKCPLQRENTSPQQTSLDNLSNQFISFPVYY